MAETFSVDTAPEEQSIPVEIDPVSGIATTPPTNPVVVDQRAVKASMAFPSVTVQEAKQNIFAGNEYQMRTAEAAKADVRRQMQMDQFLIKAAQFKGSPLTRDEHRFVLDKALMAKIQGLQQPTDPETVLEEYYAGSYLKSSVYDPMGRMPEGYMTAAIKEIPQEIKQLDQQTTGLLAKQEYINTWVENLRETVKRQPYIMMVPGLPGPGQGFFNPFLPGTRLTGYIPDFIKQAFPFYNEVQQRGNVPGVGIFEGGTLGQNLLEQSKELFRKPLPEFKEIVKTRLETLAKTNPQLALQFAEAMQGMSGNDVVLNDLLTPIELTGFGGVGRGIVKGAQKLGAYAVARSHRRDVLKAASQMEINPANIADVSGDMVEATVQRTMATIRNEVQGQGAPMKSALESLPSHYQNMAWNLGINWGGASRELVNRLEQNIHRIEDKLTEIMGTVQRVARLPTVLETEEAVRLVTKEMKDLYPGRFIGDVSPIRHEPFTNTYHVEVSVHRPNGELFRNAEVARNYARDTTALGRPDAEVVPHGSGFKIVFKQNLRETEGWFRDLLAPSLANERLSLPKAWLNFIRNPSDVQGTGQINQAVMNRKVAVYAQAELMKLMRDEGKAIRDLSRGIKRFDPVTGEPISAFYARPAAFAQRFLKGELFSKSQMWKEWESVADFSRQAQNPATREIGYFFETVGELKGHYLRHFGRVPEPIEIEAYFAYRNRTEAGRVLENLGVLRDKMRIGAERHRVFVLKEDGTKVESGDFEAVRRKARVKSNQPTLVLGTQEGMAHVYGEGNPMPPNVTKLIDKRIKEGSLRFLEILEPGKRPLSNFENVTKDLRIRYVIAPYVETRELAFEQVPLKGAFREFPYEFTVGQAIVHRQQLGNAKNPTFWYEGDRHSFGMMRRAEGANFAKHMNEVQRLLKENKIDEAKAYSNKHMTRDWDEIHAKFKDGTFSLDEPFQVIPRNGKIIDIDKKGLENRYLYKDEFGRDKPMIEDGTRAGLFAGRRSPFGDDLSDVLTVKDIGSRSNPVFDNSPTKFIDPIASMDRGLNKLVNSIFMDDYKLASIEQWIRDAEQFMVPSQFDLRSAPFYHFHKPQYKPDASKAAVRQLETQRRNIEQLIGTPNALQSFLHTTTQSLLDHSYEKLGRTRLDPEWLLPRIEDPFRFARAVVFHSTMGMYNIAQVATQLNTFVNIFAFAGTRYAGPGTAAAMLHGIAAINQSPAVLKMLDGVISSIKIPGMSHWKPGEWLQSMKELNNTGFKHVQGENITRDTQIGPQTVRGAGQAFLDGGTIFWRSAEKAVRVGAWHTAFKEWLDKNPLAKFTDRARAKVLDRADFLAAEMSRASASVMHTGILSVPMQFYAYAIRVAEAFWSAARMGPFWSAEGVKSRARVLATYGVVYGVPTSLAVTGDPLGLGERWRRSALDNGYNPGDKWLSSLLMEGVPSTMAAMITGRGDISKGNWYNINQRYGLQGLPVWQDIIRNDKGFGEIAFGAMGTKAMGAWEASDPMWKYMYALWSGKQFNLKSEHALEIMKEVSTWSQASRTIAAMNTGRWLSKRGLFLEGQGETGKPITPTNAIFMGLTGLSPQSAADTRPITITAKDLEDTQKRAVQAYTREVRRAYAAQQNPSDFNAFMTNAYFYLEVAGVPPQKWSDIHYRALDGINKTLRETLDWNRFVRDSSPDRFQRDQEAYRRSLQMRTQQ